MIDRNVEFPNRFRMTKVEGTDDIYDLIPAPGEVIAPGDTFSKANMLPDSIPAALGLKMENPQVKDALNVLANAGNLHVWERVRKTSESIPSGYTLGDIESGYIQSSTGTSSDYRPVGSYGNSLSVNAVGVASIESPNSAVYAYSSTGANSAQNQLAGKFLKSDTDPPGGVTVPNEILYFPPDATFSYITNGKSLGYPGNYCIVADKFQRVHPYAETPPGTTTDYLTSTDRNAYTEGTVDSTTITYLGQLGGGARIEVGSYVGTGTYGSSNPNSLTFGFKPKMVIIAPKHTQDWSYGFALTNQGALWVQGEEKVMTNYASSSSSMMNSTVVMTLSGKTLMWYSTYDATKQLNDSGRTFIVVAIG